MKYFNEPTIEIEKFEMVDVITTSGDESGDDWGGGFAPAGDPTVIK